jgi:hypothetical protein
MADQEVIKHVKHAVEVARSKRPWTHKLQEILLEIVIIVFAVSLSIGLHNWSEGRKDREEERDFLVGLKQDLQADLQDLQSGRGDFLNILAGTKYFVGIGNGAAPNPDSVKKYMPILFSYEEDYPRASRFEALRGSGRLGIVRDKELLVDITELYTKDFPHIARVDDYINGLRKDHLLPFFAAHAQLNATATDITNWEAFLRMPEVRIMVATLNSATNNVDAYSRAIAQIEVIVKKIEKDLE